MKIKLLCWEAAITLISLGLFLIVFSIQNGWKLVGTERYNAAASGVAVVLVIAAVVASGAASGSILATTAGAVLVTAVVGVGVAAAVGVATGVAIALIVGGIAIVIVVAGSNKELKNSFAIISLIVEVLVIFGVISAITFLF